MRVAGSWVTIDVLAKEVQVSEAGHGVRLADKTDLEAILGILNITNKAFYEAIVPADAFREPYLTAGELAGESERKIFTVYELDGRIVGVAAFEERQLGIGVVDRVYVLPEYQRRGIGAALLADIENRAKGRGIREIVLWTDPEAAWAVAFYRRLGYSEIEAEANYSDAMIAERVRRHGRQLVVLRKCLVSGRMADWP